MKLILLLLWQCFYYCKTQHIHWFQDNVGWQDKEQLLILMRENLARMQMQERQLLGLKEEHSRRMQYQVGLVIGICREKYKRMMEIYADLTNRFNKKNKIMGPGVYKNRPIHILLGLETSRMLEVEIAKYVDLILAIPKEDLTGFMDDVDDMMHKFTAASPSNNSLPAQSGSLPPGASLPPGGSLPPGFTMPPGMTMPAGAQKLPSLRAEKKEDAITEQELKQKYRDEYMKQKGFKGEDWNLDHYYGLS